MRLGAMGVYPRGREDGARIGSCKLKGRRLDAADVPVARI